jgi:hypothetical protein
MCNWDTKAALAYHEATKHSGWSIRSSPHRLDWDNKPLPFKIYRGLERIPDLVALSRVLYLAAGITKRKHHPGAHLAPLLLGFRHAACERAGCRSIRGFRAATCPGFR